MNLCRICKFSNVTSYVANLINTGINPQNILICCDWDDTLNADGAWHQCAKKYRYSTFEYDPNHFYFPSGRLIYEHEVDTQLRDSDIHEQLNLIKSMNVRFLLTTARTPISDSYILNTNTNMSLDFRTADGHIDYDKIKQEIMKHLQTCSDEQILTYAQIKVNRMIKHSSIDLRNDEQILIIPSSEVASGEYIVYYKGYGFVGHDKSNNVHMLLSRLGYMPQHLIIIDDSERVIKKYVENVSLFGKDVTLHLLHYP